MQKRGSWYLAGGVVFILILVVVLFYYFATASPNHDNYYINQEVSGGLRNPVSDLTIEEAVNVFNESFVYYLLYEIGAYDLHNPPLSKNTPKIEMVVGEEIFSATIIKGSIYIDNGEMDEEDIVIRTSREEAVKMLKSKEYIEVSFEEGSSSIELKASKTILFSKGYLGLYQDLTGKSVTGSVIRIYVE